MDTATSPAPSIWLEKKEQVPVSSSFKFEYCAVFCVRILTVDNWYFFINWILLCQPIWLVEI